MANPLLDSLDDLDPVERAVDNKWFDGRAYWWLDKDDVWRPKTQENLALHLRAAHKLTTSKTSDSVSQLELAIHRIQVENVIDSAAPSVLRHPGVRTRDRIRVLNTCRIRVMPPAADPVPEWGDRFPWIAGFLDGLFDGPPMRGATPLQYFLGWLQRFYVSGLDLNLAKGHALFIAGPTNQGKTLLSNRIVAPLMGCAAGVAGKYLSGSTNFNSNLFNSALWTVDDSHIEGDYKQRRTFTANIKQMVANWEHEWHKKFTDAATTEWLGRVIVGLNTDPEGMDLLPDAQESVMDKIMLFQTTRRSGHIPKNVEDIIRGELPFFARWLVDWTPPEAIVGDTRFGVHEYHHPILLEAAQAHSGTSAFWETLQIFMRSWVAAEGGEEAFVGTATELLAAMRNDASTASLARELSKVGVGRELMRLERIEGRGVSYHRTNSRRLWRLDRSIADEEPEGRPVS